MLCLPVTWLPVLFLNGALDSAASLFPLANSAHPYIVFEHALTLYILAPLEVLSAFILLLSPGLLLSIALNAAKGIGEWVLTGFTLSLVLVSAAAGTVQWIIGRPLKDTAFLTVIVGCSIACLGILIFRKIRGHNLVWPLAQPHWVTTVLSMLLVPVLILIVLAPKFYWENFNGDGAHAFESARLLLYQPFPFWDPLAGAITSFPGITSMLFAFPTSWFIRLFGEIEVAARLPFLLYLMALFGALLTVTELDRSKPLGITERWLIWLALLVYSVVMAFSATYNPYFADIALPATQDTLLMICFVGFILTFLRQEWYWHFLFAALTIFSLPNGMLLIGFWLISVVFIWKPLPRKQLALSAAALLVCLLLTAITPYVLRTLHHPLPGSEYALTGLLRQFAFLQWTDWRRIAFLLVPSGLLPGVALLAWRWQDRVARTLTILTIIYFGFFYIQAHIALHYFVPVMLLPLVVIWRNQLTMDTNSRSFVHAGAAITAILALLISLPENAVPDSNARIVGSAIEDRIGGYHHLDPASLRRSTILRHLFPLAWDPSVPDKSYGGSPLSWYYYAHNAKASDRDVNYVLQPAEDPPPTGMRCLATEEGVSLYLLGDLVWANHRAIRPPTPAGSKVYEIPRGILFRSVPLENGPRIISVVDVIERFGFNLDPILARLGVRR
jgi:hypothetical protein